MGYENNRWKDFKTRLPHQTDPVLSKRNWGHSWHSMCSYQGKLKPSISHCLVDSMMPQGRTGRVLDIFSGVGTIPFEARLQGHVAFAFDISPVSVMVSKAKLEKIDWRTVSSVMSDIEYLIAHKSELDVSFDGLEDIKFNGPLRSYYNEDTLREILIVREYFLEKPPSNGAEALVFSSMLHILHGNRPYALSRQSHPITPFAPVGPSEYRGVIERLAQKIAKCAKDSDGIPEVYGRSYNQDTTEEWPDEVSELDAIITSPPFFGSIQFHRANWLRLWFSGWDMPDFNENVKKFVDEKQKDGFEFYHLIFRQAVERLKKGGVFLLHLGESKKCNMAAVVLSIGEKYMKMADFFNESVAHCELHGIIDKGSTTHHQYLIFENTWGGA